MVSSAGPEDSFSCTQDLPPVVRSVSFVPLLSSNPQVYPKSAVPYEVDWRPFDSSGCELAVNPKKRIALTPRLFVGSSGTPEPAGEADPPAGTAPRGGFKLADKKFRLTVPPIGSWSIVKPDQPWGQLGPFAF